MAPEANVGAERSDVAIMAFTGHWRDASRDVAAIGWVGHGCRVDVPVQRNGHGGWRRAWVVAQRTYHIVSSFMLG